ncbi:MAG: peptidase M61, partial [Steroidobacteraceae bacterium]
LQDTTNDEIINPRRPQSWRDWQRFEDYYDEGALIWLDADTLIRERSNGQRSLDDFARSFFGIDAGSLTTVTYTFADLVRALTAVQPYDWTDFLRKRLDSTGQPAPLDGVLRGGYRLTYSDTPSGYLSAMDAQRQRVTLRYSIGIDIDDKDKAGSIAQVVWGSPAFKAGLTSGGRILAVNGVAYSADVLKDAIRTARNAAAPIELIVRTGDAFMVARVDYHGGLRYPHLVRGAATHSRLDDILAPRP